MGRTLFIMKKMQGYNLVETCKQLISATEKAGIYVSFFEDVYNSVPKDSVEGIIEEDPLSESDGQFDPVGKRQYMFNISECNIYNGSWHNPDYFKAIDFSLTSAAERHDDFFFKFATSYFEENPNDYLWYGSASLDCIYSADDIMKLKNAPYDKTWMYNKTI